MKKALILSLLLIMVFSVGCGKDKNEEVAVPEATDAVQQQEEVQEEKEPEMPVVEKLEEPEEEPEEIIEDTPEAEITEDTSEEGAENDGDENSEVAEDIANDVNKSSTASNEEMEDASRYYNTVNDNSSNAKIIKGRETISGYKGDGNGPGMKFRTDFDYANYTVDDRHDLRDITNGIVPFKASNGIVIKAVETTFNGKPAYIPICDGEGLDFVAGSPFMVACSEASNTGLDRDVTARNTDIDFVMPLATAKRSSIDANDSNLLALKESFNAQMYRYDGRINSIFFDNDSIYGRDDFMTIWQVTNLGDKWMVRLDLNPAPILWSAIHQSLRYVTPDGEHIYNFVHDAFYGLETAYNSDAIGYDTWYTFGNSQVYIPSEFWNDDSFAIVYFK